MGAVHSEQLAPARSRVLRRAILAVGVALVLAGGAATVSAAGNPIDEAVSLRLIATDLVRARLDASATLRLQISEQAGTIMHAGAQVQGDDLVANRVYTLWLVDPDGNALLMDTARADEDCEVDPDTEEESDECEVTVDLRGSQAQIPFDVVTLAGMTVNVREHSTGGEALATATVTSSMIG